MLTKSKYLLSKAVEDNERMRRYSLFFKVDFIREFLQPNWKEVDLFHPFVELFFLERQNVMIEEDRNFELVGKHTAGDGCWRRAGPGLSERTGVWENGFEEMRVQSSQGQNYQNHRSLFLKFYL